MIAHIDFLKKSKEYAFDDINVLFFDLQDTGISPDAYLNTLIKTLQSAASQNKTVVVLDRPNILGSCMEGVIAENMNCVQDVIPVRTCRPRPWDSPPMWAATRIDHGRTDPGFVALDVHQNSHARPGRGKRRSGRSPNGNPPASCELHNPA